MPEKTPPSPLAPAYGKALKLLSSGKHGGAAKAFETLMHEAQDAGDWAMKRRAQIHHDLAESSLHPPKAATPNPLTEIQACLNRRNASEALKLAEKALKSGAVKGSLHYLRAVAYAQTENAEASADALKKALELEPDLVFQWHMEPDFNPVRKSALFGFTEGR